jgi:RHS repeat-associated protein
MLHGNVSLAKDSSSELVAQAGYEPYGKLCWNGDTAMPTDFAFTGQRQDGFGLMDYNARFYSPNISGWVWQQNDAPVSVPYSVRLASCTYSDTFEIRNIIVMV